MKPINFIAQDIFDKVRSRFDNLEMGDETGSVTSSPAEARFFDFDFAIEGNKLGRVSISINEIGSLKIFYGQGILDDADRIIQTMWYDFLKEMRRFAKRRLLRFDTRDITKRNLNKSDFKYLASTGTKEETMKESAMYGSSKSSYLPLEKTRLIIRHSKAVDEMQRGSRSRNINSIYIENQDGERFKCPYNHLAGAKALQRHVANGGRPHDNLGAEIIKMSEQISQLSAFKRKVGKHDTMNAGANDILAKTDMKLEALRHQINSLSKQKNYQAWKESLMSNRGQVSVMDQATMEDYKSKFTINSYNEDLSQYFPLLYSVMQEASLVDLEEHVKEESVETQDEITENEESISELAQFEEWADAIAEGRLTRDIITDLKSLMDGDLTLGKDAISAVEALQGIGIDDMDLNNALMAVSKINPESDPKLIIASWLEKYDPAAFSQLEITDTDKAIEPTTPAIDEPPVDQDTAPPADQAAKQPVAGESSAQDTSHGKASSREIAEMIKSFYDAKTGKFPIGETGLLTKIKKEFGESAEALAEKFIKTLCAKSDDAELADIARLSGSALSRVAQRAQARKEK